MGKRVADILETAGIVPYHYDRAADIAVVNADALETLAKLPDNSVDLIATDPPYMGVKDHDWDNQWANVAEYIAWIGSLCEQWQRVLKPNGSLYCFASPKMAAQVEVEIGRWFNIVNRITWAKSGTGASSNAGWHQKQCKEELRSFFPASEGLIFAEQRAANEAITFADYELNGHVYATLKEWFRSRARKAGINNGQFNRLLGFAANGGGVASGVIGDKIQFSMPTSEVYAKMQAAFPVFDREYEDLRREYEDLRRPFTVSADVPYTDVWTFPIVASYAGKHPCEKPAAMMRHIIQASSRPGAIVLDCFGGSGVVGRECRELGRAAILVERDPHWAEQCKRRVEGLRPQPMLPPVREVDERERFPLFT